MNKIYCDGSCLGNPGPGGWAAVIHIGDQKIALSGSDANTTNNRMELVAAINGIREVLKVTKAPFVVWTDSVYVQKGITEWVPSWKRRNWRRSQGEIKNLSLWQQLDELNQASCIEWRWLKGHAGHPGNEEADQLARQAAEEVKACLQ